MNVLFLLDTVWTQRKSAGVQSLFLLLSKMEKKHHITIYTYDRFLSQEDLPNAVIKIFKMPSISTSYRVINFVLTHILIFYVNLRYIIAGFRERPDIIYCSSALPIMSCIVLRWFSKAKTIHRIYGTFLKVGASLFHYCKNYLEVLAFKSYADKYIITDDGTMGDKVAENLGVAMNKVAFLKNGVNRVDLSAKAEHSRVIRNKFSIPVDATVFISACRLSRWKRVDRLIRAFHRAASDVYLLVIGDGPDEVSLKALAKNDKIIFVGSVKNIELPLYLMASDVYVSAYDFSNLGNSLFEALSTGLPVLTIATGDTGAVICEESNNGVLIQEWVDEEELCNQIVNKIELLSADKVLLKSLSEGALKYSEGFKTWDERIDLEVKIIEGL